MKRWLSFFIIQILFFSSCGLFSQKQDYLDPKEEIGKNISNVNHDVDRLFVTTDIDGISYNASAFCYNDKILVYVYNTEGYIIDCYYTNFVQYYKVKKIKLGTHYSHISKKIGEPVYAFYSTSGNTFSYHYLQKEHNVTVKNKKNNFALFAVSFYFDKEGKLMGIREYGTGSLWP